MRDLDYLCVGWFADCGVQWDAVEAIWTAAGAVFTLFGLLLTANAVKTAALQVKVAQQAAAEAASEIADRRKRDGAALAAAINQELGRLIDVVSDLAFVDNANLERRWRAAFENRDGVDLPILRSAVLHLGCFSVDLSSALGTALVKVDSLRATLPKPIRSDNGLAVRYAQSATDARARAIAVVESCEFASKLMMDYLKAP